jgi:predicted HTH transcriptional regulator
MTRIQKKKPSSEPRHIKTKPKTKNSLKKTVVSKQPNLPYVSTRQLLSQSEGLQVDFKRDAEAVKSDDLVAFANGGGGTILVGVDEIIGTKGAQRGKVVGCDASDRERNKIVSRANTCRPSIPIKVSVESHGKRNIMRVDIPKHGLHCTANGTYKIHRDGQNDIIDPSLMVEIIVKLERNKILGYLREAVRPEIENAQVDMEAMYDEARAEIEDLRGELEDARDYDDR